MDAGFEQQLNQENTTINNNQETSQTHKYRLVRHPSDLRGGGGLALGVRSFPPLHNHQPEQHHNPAEQEVSSLQLAGDRIKPACSPVRVSQCFCVTTVEYD